MKSHGPWWPALLLTVALCPVAHSAPLDRKLNVLLVTSAGTREYQFLRSLLARAMGKKQLEVCVYLQPFEDKPDSKRTDSTELPEARYLARFPDQLRAPEKETDAERFANLRSFDVLVAIDFDWSRLNAKQAETLGKWIEAGGGLIVVAGPVHTPMIVTKDEAGCKLLRELLPVELEHKKDKGERDKPFRLNFPEQSEPSTLLQLDPKGKGPTAGWEIFFSDRDKADPAAPLVRGFYNYYPVKKVKKEAVVLATLADPTAKLEDGKEQPFLVTGKRDKGRIVYLSSGELWRLRQQREAAHEALWMQLLRYTAGVETK